VIPGPIIAAHAVYSLTTLFMLAVMLRWLGPWIGVDLSLGRFGWLCRLTDPVVNRVRRIVPPMGPWDVGPLATLLTLWIARSIVVQLLVSAGSRGAA
jgi:YggT family protein